MGSKDELFLIMLAGNHREMEGAVSEIQQMIECLGDRSLENLSRSLDPKVETLKELFIDHCQQEERVLIPILGQMYGNEAGICQYIKDEHSYINQELRYILELIRRREQDLCFPENELTVSRILALLEEIVVHVFEEENGLFPLVSGYMKIL